MALRSGVTLSLVLLFGCLFRDLDSNTEGPDGSIAQPPPDPTALIATALSATRMRLNWQSGGGSTAGFRIAFRDDGVAPSDCDGAIPESEIFGTTHDVSGLEPDARYDFRLCAINSNAPPDSSPGVTASAATPAAPTLPPCDTTVPAGNYTMANFQSLLSQAVTNGDGGDGTVAVCVDDGVVVGPEGGDTIQIPGDNLFIFAHDGDEARFINPSNTIFEIQGRTNVRLHNLYLRPGGWGGSGVVLAGGDVTRLSNLRIDIDSGTGAGVNAYWSSTLGEVTGLEINAEGGDETAGIILGEGSTLTSLADTHITTFDRNVGILLESSSIGIIQSTTITTGGAGAHGILLRRDSHIDAMSEVTLRRLGPAGAESDAYAIVCDDALGAGGNEYFDTSAIHDVTLCSTFDAARWTGSLADTSDGAVYVEPATHVAFAGGGRGSATFPFDDGLSTAGTDQRITMNGTCFTGAPAAEVLVSSDLTFAAFQTVLNDAHADGDLDGDGLITVRIADGVIVRNTNTLAQQRIVIPGNDFHLYAEPGDTATFLNERTNGAAETDHGVLYSVGMHNLSLINLTLRSTGEDGVVVRTSSAFGGDTASIVVLDHLTVRSDGERANAVILGDTTVQAVTNTTVTTTGRYATPLETGCGAHINRVEDSSFVGSNADINGLHVGCSASINSMRRVTIETTGDLAPGLVVYKNSAISSLEGSTIRTAGEHSHGLLLAGSSALGAADNLTLARASGASAVAVAILFDPDMGTDNYVDSPNLVNVSVCTESGGLAWEAGGGSLLADGEDIGPWTAPAAHVPHLPGPIYGAQTFPFEDPARTAQSIQFGGTCP